MSMRCNRKFRFYKCLQLLSALLGFLNSSFGYSDDSTIEENGMNNLYRRISVESFGGPEKLKVEKFTGLKPLTESDVLVNVGYVGVNRADLLLREGKYHIKTLPVVPGLEASGIVASAGGKFSKGDRVLIFKAQSGMYSEQVCVQSTALIKIPENVSLEIAASLPLNWLTASQCMTKLIDIQAGQSVAVFSAASGVGQAAIQIAKHVGVRVVGIVSSERKAKFLNDRYGIEAFVGREPDELDRVLSTIKSDGFDGILDLQGGKFFRSALKGVCSGGTVAQCANPSLEDSQINVRDFYPRNISIKGFQYGNLIALGRDTFFEQLKSVLQGFEQGYYQPLDLKIFDLADAGEAHTSLGNREFIGKVLLRTGACE